MAQIILITGASSGFGNLTARALAEAGHTVYASMRDTTGKNAGKVADAAVFAQHKEVDLRTIELDVGSEESATDAVARIIAEHGRIDVVMHNAGHMMYGPTEAFTPEQLAQQYDTNVLSTQRVNRAALPHMRNAGQGLFIWNSSSNVAGGMPLYLGRYFAAKAGMDALAVILARELVLWGIETPIVVPGVVPGAFTKERTWPSATRSFPSHLPERQFDTVMTAHDQVIGAPPYPNWTAMGVTWLAGFDFKIKAIARIPEPSVAEGKHA